MDRVIRRRLKWVRNNGKWQMDGEIADEQIALAARKGVDFLNETPFFHGRPGTPTSLVARILVHEPRNTLITHESNIPPSVLFCCIILVVVTAAMMVMVAVMMMKMMKMMKMKMMMMRSTAIPMRHLMDDVDIHRRRWRSSTKAAA
jgi:hypothetical protein